MDPGHKARKDPSGNADLDFQVIRPPALRIMLLNVEGLSTATLSIIGNATTVMPVVHSGINNPNFIKFRQS